MWVNCGKRATHLMLNHVLILFYSMHIIYLFWILNTLYSTCAFLLLLLGHNKDLRNELCFFDQVLKIYDFTEFTQQMIFMIGKKPSHHKNDMGATITLQFLSDNRENEWNIYKFYIEIHEYFVLTVLLFIYFYILTLNRFLIEFFFFLEKLYSRKKKVVARPMRIFLWLCREPRTHDPIKCSNAKPII